MTGFARRFVKDEAGAAAIEYGLIAALVAVAAVGALSAVGSPIDDFLHQVSARLDPVVAPAHETPVGPASAN